MKNKIRKLSIMMVIFIMLFTLTGCGNNNENNTIVEEKSQEGTLLTADINPELEGVYAFANKTEEGKASTVALKEDGSEVTLVEHNLEEGKQVEYEALDYSFGKLYLQKGTEFFSIDLNQGDGNYQLESIYNVSSEPDWTPKIMYVYDGVLYYNRGNQLIEGHDLETKQTKEIEYNGDIDGSFVVDKKRGYIYYTKSPVKIFRDDWGGALGTYNIATGEKTELKTAEYKKSTDSNTEAGKRFYIGPVTDNGFIYYERVEGNYGVDEASGYEFTSKTTGYEYNVTTAEETKIDEYMDEYGFGNTSFYDNGKLYYATNRDLGPSSTQYTLKINEKEKIKEIIEATPDSNIDEIYVLSNGDIQAEIDGNNYDTYEAYIDTYIINKDTFEKNKTNVTYRNMSYIVEGSDTHTENKTEENEEGIITKEDLVGEWRATTTDSLEFGISFVLGSQLTKNNSIVFNEDGTYNMGMSFEYNQAGNYEIEGNKVKLLNNQRTDKNPIDTIVDELLISKEEGNIVLLLPTKQTTTNTKEELTVNIRIEKKKIN